MARGDAPGRTHGHAPGEVEVELEIDSLAAGGDGVGRAPDGRVIFVPGTAPGDRVRVRLSHEAPPGRRRRHARGELVALREGGPGRVVPSCPVFGDCGGCTWQHLAYEVQLEAKSRILRDALQRIGRLSLPGPTRITPSPRPYGYRGRARVVAAGGRVGYRRRGSHALCAVSRCPVLLPGLERALSHLAAAALPDGEWELSAGEGGVRVARLGAPASPGAPATARSAPQAFPVSADARSAPEAFPVPADARVDLAVGAERIGFSAGVFAQSNALLLETLCERVVEWAGEGDLALELYAGAGLFTLPLARRFARVVAVEGHARAASDLRANLARAGLDHVDVRAQPVEELRSAALAPDVVVLDPPRAGVAAVVAEALAEMAPRVVYLSCDPATLARDLARLVGAGLELRCVEGFDLFPQTPHVEALALLERG